MAPTGEVEPNGSQNKKCKKCNIVPANGVKCITCGMTMHPGCLKYFNNITRIDDNLMNCCNDDMSRENEKSHSNSKSEISFDLNAKITYLENILIEKDKQITILSKNNDALITQLAVVNQLLLIPVGSRSSDTKEEKIVQPTLKDSKKSAKKSNNISIPTVPTSSNKSTNETYKIPQKTDNKATITTDQLKLAIVETETRKIMQDVIELPLNGSNEQLKPSSTSKKFYRSKPVIGTGAKNAISTLKAAPKKTYLHISRLDPDTKESDILEYLASTTKEITCEKMNSMAPQIYSSFKIGVDQKFVEKLLTPESWPNGVTVKLFFHKKKQMCTKSLPLFAI
ncbi:hypothetical protein RI129_012043 [Pyrocoelia pectoralis]|uniref:Phorbol-ester/DAG-type domain-containing protein n=1 Tax=Pyrocoelia pectoralis TaxID=417401 RepID=A0AAN7V603_9COLE